MTAIPESAPAPGGGAHGGIDPSTIARFRTDLERLIHRPPHPASRLGVAVSGGADSLALLLLAVAAYPGAVAAATVDHGLRAESSAEADFVAAICRRLAVPHDRLAVQPNVLCKGNLQTRARAARYGVLGRWARSDGDVAARPWTVAAVATAHHRDDVAEGFVMRARRGAGVGGLAAMADIRGFPGGAGPPLVRPLLTWSHEELAALVASAGIVAVADPSNVHPRFDRSRVRALLATEPDLPPARLAMAAHNLRHAEEALRWAAAREWDHRAETDPGPDAGPAILLDCAGLPYELRRRLVLRAVEQVRSAFAVPGDWAGTGLDRLVAGLDAGRSGTLAGVAARAGTRWRFEPAPPRRSH